MLVKEHTLSADSDCSGTFYEGRGRKNCCTLLFTVEDMPDILKVDWWYRWLHYSIANAQLEKNFNPFTLTLIARHFFLLRNLDTHSDEFYFHGLPRENLSKYITTSLSSWTEAATTTTAAAVVTTVPSTIPFEGGGPFSELSFTTSRSACFLVTTGFQIDEQITSSDGEHFSPASVSFEEKEENIFSSSLETPPPLHPALMKLSKQLDSELNFTSTSTTSSTSSSSVSNGTSTRPGSCTDSVMNFQASTLDPSDFSSLPVPSRITIPPNSGGITGEESTYFQAVSQLLASPPAIHNSQS
ncbi:hypothetical protein Aperf_G00000050372 [Anoplocephala perfoliata]